MPGLGIEGSLRQLGLGLVRVSARIRVWFAHMTVAGRTLLMNCLVGMPVGLRCLL